MRLWCEGACGFRIEAKGDVGPFRSTVTVLILQQMVTLHCQLCVVEVFSEAFLVQRQL